MKLKGFTLFLYYKHNKVTAEVLKEDGKSFFLLSTASSLEERDNSKLKVFTSALREIKKSSYRGTVNVILTGKYFERWVTGKTFPPAHLVENTMSAIKVLDSCLFVINFKQLTRVTREIKENTVQVENNSVLDLINELEAENEE